MPKNDFKNWQIQIPRSLYRRLKIIALEEEIPIRTMVKKEIEQFQSDLIKFIEQYDKRDGLNASNCTAEIISEN